jgi:hypothetical protein
MNMGQGTEREFFRADIFKIGDYPHFPQPALLRLSNLILCRPTYIVRHSLFLPYPSSFAQQVVARQ